MEYLVQFPKGYDPLQWRPLIVFLHGAGERGKDLNKVKRHGPWRMLQDSDYPFILAAPQCPKNDHWRPHVVEELIEDALSNYAVDPRRIYLTGISMGGFGVFAYLARHSHRIAAAIPICGGGDPADAPAMVNTPIWMFHGSEDPVVPVKLSRDMHEALNAAGADSRLTVYEGLKHDSWTRTYSDPSIYEWLLSHSLADTEEAPNEGITVQ